jgi:magnesium transporter
MFPARCLQTDLEPDVILQTFRNRRGVIWEDFVAEPPEVCEPLFQSFGFHPLAIDDALQKTRSPKIDDWDHCIYLMLN